MVLTKQDLIDAEVMIGDNIEEAVYILADGTLWDGGFDYGSRGVEHREAEQFSRYDRYDGDAFWQDVMINMGLVMLIPESREVLIHPKHKVTEAQQKRIDEAISKGFEVAEFK